MALENPVLVEVTRGDLVECGHRGRVAVFRGGALDFALGDVEALTFPRSSVKIIQALPLIESGAAEHFHFGDEALCLACASHEGEDSHAECAQKTLAGMGLSEEDLRCGTHRPFSRSTIEKMAARGEKADQLRNNCSGKHTGMLAAAKHLGYATDDYVEWSHPLQARIRDSFSELTEVDHHGAPFDRDGCSLPTYAAPLSAFALAFEKMASGRGLNASRFAAVQTLQQAVANQPHYVAGTNRVCTQVMELLGKRAFIKTGAEGVYCASLPEVGLGIALKIDDGAERASEAVICHLLAHYLPLSPEERKKLLAIGNKPMQNFRGFTFGEIRVSDALPALSL